MKYEYEISQILPLDFVTRIVAKMLQMIVIIINFFFLLSVFFFSLENVKKTYRSKNKLADWEQQHFRPYDKARTIRVSIHKHALLLLWFVLQLTN